MKATGSNVSDCCSDGEMILANLPDPEQLASRIRRGERAAVASGLNLLDNKRGEARTCSARLLASLSGVRWLNEGHLIGVTGPPGAGKSSLVSAMIRAWRLSGRTVGVLAVDPSSRPELGGGALLGDRIRIKNTSHDEGLFIRSLANRNQMGGVATEVWPMSWLMLACFDIVVIETVGVGQTEIEIAEIADTVCYVAQPASGDAIQYLKSGIIEIPDIFAVNKSDLGAAARKTAAEIGRSAHRSLCGHRSACPHRGWHHGRCALRHRRPYPDRARQPHFPVQFAGCDSARQKIRGRALRAAYRRSQHDSRVLHLQHRFTR